MIKRKSDYVINKIADGSSIQLIIDAEYKEFIQKKPYVLNTIVTSHNNALIIHINFDPRYDKDEALIELEKDIYNEISKRVYGQIESLNFAISISPKLKEAFPKLPANNVLNEDIF